MNEIRVVTVDEIVDGLRAAAQHQQLGVTVKQNALNLQATLDDSREGLISLEALERATAQLPTAKRTSRVTIGSCRLSSPNKQVQRMH